MIQALQILRFWASFLVLASHAGERLDGFAERYGVQAC